MITGRLAFLASLLLVLPLPALVGEGEARAAEPETPQGGTSPTTLLNGSTEATPHGTWSGTYQNTGINLQSARQTSDGLVLRVKRRIKPGGDAAKEFARTLPIFSTAANLATLGLYKRVLRSDGEAVRATWLTLNCKQKTFNVSGDGYSWQNIYNDQYGQAEDLYYGFCEAKEANAKPAYLSLPPADRDMLKAAQIER